MPTIQEYAQLANRVYARTAENRTTVPIGWTELQWIPDRALTGFSAGVYQNGNDIVISYTGTNEKKVKDFAVANLPAAGPLPSAQVWEAMELYLEVKRDHPGANITFTCHSLGAVLPKVRLAVPALGFYREASLGAAMRVGNPRALLGGRQQQATGRVAGKAPPLAAPHASARVGLLPSRSRRRRFRPVRRGPIGFTKGSPLFQASNIL